MFEVQTKGPAAWLRAASLTGEEGITIREVCAVLQAMLIEMLDTGSWPRWATGGHVLSEPSLQLVVAEIGEALDVELHTRGNLVHFFFFPPVCAGQLSGSGAPKGPL